MTVLDAIRQRIAACPHLDGLAGGIKTDWLNQDDPTDYGIFNGGDVIIETYMNGDSRKQMTFYLQSCRMGAEDVLRLENSEHVENVQNWVNDRQFEAFPLPDGCDFERITVGNGTPVDVSDNGQMFVYRITGNLIYERTV